MKKIFLLLTMLLLTSCSLMQEIRDEVNEALAEEGISIGRQEPFVVSPYETNPLVGNWNIDVFETVGEPLTLSFLPEGEIWQTLFRRMRLIGTWSVYDSEITISFSDENDLNGTWTFSVMDDVLTLRKTNPPETHTFVRMP
jgi:hypothetical protein